MKKFGPLGSANGNVAMAMARSAILSAEDLVTVSTFRFKSRSGEVNIQLFV